MNHILEKGNEVDNPAVLFDQLAKAARYAQKTTLGKVFCRPIHAGIFWLVSRGLPLSTWTVPIRIRTFFGEYMNLILPEAVSLNIFLNGFTEEGLSCALVQYLRPGMNFVDIGAHFGFFSLLARRLVGFKGQIHSFEPSDATFRILESNLRGPHNVFLNQTALWSERSFLVLHDMGLRHSAFNSITAPRLPGQDHLLLGARPMHTQCTTLDDYCSRVGFVPHFVKIDAESSEWDILQGMKDTIRLYHPAICLEVGDLGIPGVVRSLDSVLFLLERGYDAYEYRHTEFLPHRLRSEPYDCGNLFFLPGNQHRSPGETLG
jgi:FkbM family methyltransferase